MVPDVKCDNNIVTPSNSELSEHNMKIASRAAAAGLSVLALKKKQPKTLRFTERDRDITSAAQQTSIEAWRKKWNYPSYMQPYGVGSTLKPSTLIGWASRKRKDNWVLAFGASPGLVGGLVVDCDDVGGTRYQEWLDLNGEEIDFMRTPITVSGSGGWHIWYANPEMFGNPKFKDLFSADIKAVGGQVVLPGMSVQAKVDGDPPRHYTRLPGTPDLFETIAAGALPPMPQCLTDLLTKHREGLEKKAGSGKSLTDTDPDVLVALEALAMGRDGPKPDIKAMVAKILRNPQAAVLWRDTVIVDGKRDGSAGRCRLIRHMMAVFGHQNVTVHDIKDVLTHWGDKAKGTNDFGNREFARLHVNLTREAIFNAENDSSKLFGAVVDEDDAESDEPAEQQGPQVQVEPVIAEAARVDLAKAWSDVRFGWQMGEMERPAAVLLETALKAGVRPRVLRDVESLLYRVGRGDFEVPDEPPVGLVVTPKLETLPRGIVLPVDVPFRSLEEITKREWLAFPTHPCGVVGTITGPGGVAKSRLAVAEAFAIVTGRPEIAGFAPDAEMKRGNAWLHIQEDSLDETDRRIAALAKMYKVPVSEYDGSKRFKLFRTSGLDTPLTLAWRDDQKKVVVNPNLSVIRDFIAKNKIVHFTFDPVVELHALNENDNAEMALVYGAARSIAEPTGSCGTLVSHTKKPEGSNSMAGDMYASRGASATANSVRVSRTVFTMSEKEAGDIGVKVEDRFDFMRVDDAKNNLAAVRHKAQWFKRTAVQNGEKRRDDVAIVVPHVFGRKLVVERSKVLAEAFYRLMETSFNDGQPWDLKVVLPDAGDFADELKKLKGIKLSREFRRRVMQDKVSIETSRGTLTYKNEGTTTPYKLTITKRNEAEFTVVDDEDEGVA